MFHLFGSSAYLLLGIVISTTDIKHRIIRNRELLVLLVVGLIVNYSQFKPEMFRSLIFVTIFCLALYLIFHGKIGAGDIKLFWVISFWTPTFIQWLEGLTMAWLLGGLFAIAYATFNRLKGKLIPSIPFAPFIFVGFLPVI